MKAKLFIKILKQKNLKKRDRAKMQMMELIQTIALQMKKMIS